MPDDFQFKPEDESSPEEDHVDLTAQEDPPLEEGTFSDADAATPTADQSEDGVGGLESAETDSVPQSPAWAEELERAGFQSFDDVDNAVKALVDSNRRRDEQIATYADQLKFYQRALQERDQSSTTAPAPDAQPDSDPLDPLAQMLEGWDDLPLAHQYIQVDADGNRVISEDADEATREKILNLDRKMRKWQEVLADPRQFAAAIDQRVERMIQDKFESNFEQKQTQAEEQGYVNHFFSNNASWLFQRDPATGDYIRDPVRNNEYVYSEQGRQFFDHCRQFEADGVSSVRKQMEYASMAMGNPSAVVSQETKQASTNQIAQQKRNAMRGRSNTASSRQREFNGVTAESGGDETGREQMSWGEQVTSDMQAGVQ